MSRLQEGSQNGVGATAVNRRRGRGAHQDAQLPAVRVQSPASVLLKVQHLNANKTQRLRNITQAHSRVLAPVARLQPALPTLDINSI